MKIIDLTKEYEATYLMCLEDWSEEMKEAGNSKCEWYEKMKDNNLGVKLAVDDKGIVGGMIQYVPIEYSAASGQDLYFIDCIWVHGHKEGKGNFQKKGMGKALLAAAEADVILRGAKGIVAWGLKMPIWMKASWYKKHGYKKIETDKMAVLLWKPFSEDAIPPKWVKQVKHPLANANPGKVTVTAFYNGRCQVQCIALERARRGVKEYGDQVVLVEINTFDREIFLEWGIADALYVEDTNLTKGPPVTYERIIKVIDKKLKHIA